jgi:hypothetical protein
MLDTIVVTSGSLPPLSSVSVSMNSLPPPIAIPAAVATAITATVATGPATATRNSAPAVSGSERMCISPPNRNRSMPETWMPSRRATSAWPISWTMIEPKNRNASTTAAT